MSAQQYKIYSAWMLKNPISGDAYRLQFGINSIGMHARSFVRIENSRLVSEQHAEIIVLNDETVHICDAGSTNGTFINGEMLLLRDETLSLEHGDYVGFGVEIKPNGNGIFDPIYQLQFVPLPYAINIIPQLNDSIASLYSTDCDLSISADDDDTQDNSNSDSSFSTISMNSTASEDDFADFYFSDSGISSLNDDSSDANMTWDDYFSNNSYASDCSDPAVNDLTTNSIDLYNSDSYDDDDHGDDENNLFR